MVIEKNKCIKIQLPNGKVADVLGSVLDEISKWIQIETESPESGGYIVGYQHIKTGNITLESVSSPCALDIKNRVRFNLRDPWHKTFLKKLERKKSYYVGVWHTHPQVYPIPSSIDWNDWKETMKIDKSGSQYMFFIIAGTGFWRIWIGDMSTGVIVEGKEHFKDLSGIYYKESD